MKPQASKDITQYKDSPLSFFRELTAQIDQKKLIYFSNAFTLYEGLLSKQPVFLIEISYLCEEMLSKYSLLTQFQENLLKFVPNEKSLQRIGFFYNKGESLFSLLYDRTNMTPLLLQSDASILQKYQYFYCLLTIVSSFHSHGYSLGLIHPGLIFVDESLKMYTLDNIFYSLIPLIKRKDNIQMMSYFGYFQPDLYDQIISSYQFNIKADSLFLKTDILMLCVMFKYLFSLKSYDTILCECEVYMNTPNSSFGIEKEAVLTQFLTDILSNDYYKISSIKEMIQAFSPIFSNETKKNNSNLSAFVCLKCGIKSSPYSTFHKCEEKKGKKKKELKDKELLDLLSKQIDNLPHLKTQSLYDQYSANETVLNNKIELLHEDITLLIKNEEMKFNILMDYAQNMFKDIEKEKRTALNEKITQFDEVIKQLTEDFLVKVKEMRNSSSMSFKSGRRDNVIRIESGCLFTYITTLDNHKKELKECKKEYEDFVKNSQKIIGHANYEAKLEDLMNKIKEEYLKFINFTIDYLFSFQEKIEDNTDLLKKGMTLYNQMKSKQDEAKKQEEKENEKEKDDEGEEQLINLLKNK